MFGMFPKMIIPVLVYIAVAYASAMSGGGAEGFVGDIDRFQSGTCAGMENAAPDAEPCREGALNGTLFSVDMLSGGVWTLSTGDIILILGLVFLFIEMVKSANSGTSTIVNHGLSMGVFVICLGLFLMAPLFATSTFFLLTLMTLLDVVAGFTVTAIAARRDLGAG
ncbi:hypothetical protein DDZ18_13000 [Marinicauda salina]|uniref:Uncharacterized protein n=1 Tax=Marinicauda salina TaxID=2135793 RepID=A0A2U2BR15_9PROT|nr:hypothetical protein DDZ18_13000 [Marinicauda salina]